MPAEVGEAGHGILVRDWLPRPLVADEAEVCWVNRPASGYLQGLVFADGSSFWPGIDGLARAGWALVEVDRFGAFRRAAYGAVPWDRAPGQTSREAEDYACFMSAQLVDWGSTLFVDYQGTVSTARGPPEAAVGPRAVNAHMWGISSPCMRLA